MDINRNKFSSIFLIIVVGSFVAFLLNSCVSQDGCTNVAALNYDPAADQDDGSCLYTLAIPTIYEFNRGAVDGDSSVVILEGGGGSTVSYNAASMRHLLIKDLNSIIGDLGTFEAVSISSENLLEYYNASEFGNSIIWQNTSFPSLQETYSEISTSINLANGINNSYGAGDSILNWLDTIAVCSFELVKLGTSAVYTQANGVDLKERIHKTLLGAVIYHNAVQQMISVENADNNSLVNNQNYTSREHAWDLLVGYFGAARNYSLCSDAELSNNDFTAKDLADNEGNTDGLLDWTSEYSFDFSRMAAERDVNAPDRDFTGQIFSLFLEGRTAITNRDNDTFTTNLDSLELILEQLVGANLVHHINQTLQQMTMLGTDDENIEGLNREWSAMLGFAQMFRYRNASGSSPLSDETLEEMLALIGISPNYAAVGSDEQVAYMADLDAVKALLQTAYGFSDLELEVW